MHRSISRRVALGSWGAFSLVVVAACGGGGSGAGGNAGGNVGTASGSGGGQSSGSGAGGGFGSGGVPTVEAGYGPGPGQAPIRRLTNEEYLASVQDLFPGIVLPALEFTPDTAVAGLRNLASTQTSTLARVEQYEAAAQVVAEAVTADPTSLTGCDAAQAGEVICAEPYFLGLGRRAYRRPLTAEEAQSFSTLFGANADSADYLARLRIVIQSILLSPHFLFRPEFGVPAAGDVVALTPWELATRLSYFIVGSTPDVELGAAADAGQLNTPEQVMAQATRLLADPRARGHLVNFHRAWLGVERVGALVKDEELYPSFTPNLASAMGEETRRFLEHVLFSGAATYRDLFTAPYTFANAGLAAFYGRPAPATDWDRIEQDPAQRAGILTQASLLATMAKEEDTDAIRRGKFVLGQVLCQTVLPPPANVVAQFPQMDLDLTMRDRLAAHTQEPVCATCHSLLDPIGLTFEHYDATGAWRDTDRGMALDVTGQVLGTPVDGAVELSAVVAEHPDARRCYVTQWFRFALGRLNASGDAADDGLLDHVAVSFSSDSQLTSVVTTLVQSNGFRFRLAQLAGGAP
jgi:hypothetical protein